MSLQVSDRDPGFWLTSVGLILVWPNKPKRGKKIYHESLFTYYRGNVTVGLWMSSGGLSGLCLSDPVLWYQG